MDNSKRKSQKYKEKPSINRQKAEREISAGLVIFRRTQEGPKFLLLYHGGRYWNFPKGKIEAEEKSLEAAIRETREETGLHEEELKLKKKFRAYERYRFFRNKKPVFKIVIFYLAETRIRQIRLSKEHEGFGWFLYRDARNMLRAYKDSETVLKQAYTFLRKRPETREQRLETGDKNNSTHALLRRRPA